MTHAAREQSCVAVHEGLGGFDEMMGGLSLSWQQEKSILGMMGVRLAYPKGSVRRSGIMAFGKLWLDRAVSEAGREP